MRKLTRLGVLLAALPALALGGEPAPSWIHGEPPPKWSRSSFLVGVGSGKNREAASANARRALAEAIRSKVSGKLSVDSRSSTVVRTDGGATGEDSTDAGSRVEVETDVLLRGAEVVESYEDPATGTVHALAVVDKLKARNAYSVDLARIHGEIASKRTRFEADPRPALGQEILDLAHRHEELNRELGALAEGRGLPPALSGGEADAIRAKIRQIASERRIQVEAVGRQADASEEAVELLQLVIACLGGKGLQTIPKGEGTAPYSIRVELEAKKQPIQVEGWVKFGYLASTTLKRAESPSTQLVSTASAPGRSRGAAFDSVKNRLADEICGKTAEAVGQ